MGLGNWDGKVKGIRENKDGWFLRKEVSNQEPQFSKRKVRGTIEKGWIGNALH